MRVKALLALTSVVLTLVVLEFVLARFAPQRTMDHVVSIRAPIFQSSEFFPFELIPTIQGREIEHEGEFDVAVKINSSGYRQDQFDARKSDRTKRIVAIGDSFTFGAGVENEEAWPRMLERDLRAAGLGPVEVINAGVAGRWVDEYYLELKRRTLDLHPDLVLIGLFIGNDIDGKDARTHRWPEVDAQGLPVKVEIPGHRVEGGQRLENTLRTRWTLPIVRNSNVAQLFYDGGKALVQLLSTPHLDEEMMYFDTYEPETERALGQVEMLLRAMSDLCRKHGIGLMVVLIPTREQVSPELAGGPSSRDWDKPQRLLSQFLRSADIPFVDLLPIQREATTQAPLYFRYDGHWNARGHAVAAHAVAERLARDGFGCCARRQIATKDAAGMITTPAATSKAGAGEAPAAANAP